MLISLFAHLARPATFVLLQTGGAREQLNPWQLIMDASPIVKGVMVILALMFVVSVFVMGAKALRVMTAQSSSAKFLARFWKSGGSDNDWTTERLEGVYASVKTFPRSPLATVFKQGYVELARTMGVAQDSGGSTEADLENVERALKRTANNELTNLETMLPFLATTGSTAPFIGLFGTVWGIMNSFVEIRNQGSAGIDAVAPGIAEALIVTAIGLATAIPAVMAYNFFVRRIRVLEAEMESFSSDYLNIVRRHFLRN